MTNFEAGKTLDDLDTDPDTKEALRTMFPEWTKENFKSLQDMMEKIKRKREAEGRLRDTSVALGFNKPVTMDEMIEGIRSLYNDANDV